MPSRFKSEHVTCCIVGVPTVTVIESAKVNQELEAKLGPVVVLRNMYILLLFPDAVITSFFPSPSISATASVPRAENIGVTLMEALSKLVVRKLVAGTDAIAL